MSTRATYSFESTDYAPRTVIYVHHDGYTEGAATYFYNMLTSPSNGCFATQFIRANKGAEITKSHDFHGDTEFRYHVKGLEVKAEKRYGENWRCVFFGLLYDFVNQYAPKGFADDFKPFRRVEIDCYGAQWMNEHTALAILNETNGAGSSLPTLKIWDKNKVMDRGSANYRSLAKRILNIVNAFPELMTEEIREITDISEPATIASIVRMQRTNTEA